MLTRTMRLTASVVAGVALSVAGAGVAQASHGADDPPGHEAQHHHGHHHNHGNEDHHQGHGADDGPNHH
jgi:Spy/CpxP family protein refolding chaperone